MLLFILGCAPGSIVLTNPDGSPVGDSGVTGDTGQVDDTGEVQGEPDFSVWDGERVISTEEGCEEALGEEGYELGPEWEYYDYVVDYCPECDHYYYVEVGPDEVCGIDVASEVIRGVVLGDGQAEVWTFYPGDPDTLDDDATFDGRVIEYSYRLWDGYLDIEGRVEFPVLD